MRTAPLEPMNAGDRSALECTRPRFTRWYKPCGSMPCRVWACQQSPPHSPATRTYTYMYARVRTQGMLSTTRVPLLPPMHTPVAPMPNVLTSDKATMHARDYMCNTHCAHNVGMLMHMRSQPTSEAHSNVRTQTHSVRTCRYTLEETHT